MPETVGPKSSVTLALCDASANNNVGALKIRMEFAGML